MRIRKKNRPRRRRGGFVRFPCSHVGTYEMGGRHGRRVDAARAGVGRRERRGMESEAVCPSGFLGRDADRLMVVRHRTGASRPDHPMRRSLKAATTSRSRLSADLQTLVFFGFVITHPRTAPPPAGAMTSHRQAPVVHPGLRRNAPGCARDYEGAMSTSARCGHDKHLTAALVQAFLRAGHEPHRVVKLSGIGAHPRRRRTCWAGARLQRRARADAGAGHGRQRRRTGAAHLGISGDGDSLSIGWASWGTPSAAT